MTREQNQMTLGFHSGAVPKGDAGDGHVAAAAQRKMLRLPQQTALADLQVGVEE